MHQPEAESLYKGEAVLRATHALSCFSKEKPRWTDTELAAATGVPKNTLTGILNTLVAHGMLMREADNVFQLGLAWLRLGALRRNQFDIRSSAIPLMRSIRDEVNETVILTVRVGEQRVHVDYVEGAQATRRIAQIGASGPLHEGASGVALLSVLPKSEERTYLDRLRTASDQIDIERLSEQIEAARRHGFAEAIGTMSVDAAAVSAAVRLYGGHCAAVTVSCPIERFDNQLKTRCVKLVKSAVAQISLKLGAFV